MGELIAVLSGKGGTGKTSVCAGVSSALAEAGCRVLCIDCDVGLRNLDISLGLSDSNALSFADLFGGGYLLEELQPHPLLPSLYFLTAPINCEPEQIDSGAFRELLRRCRERFDYILLDAPAGVDAGFRLAAAEADRILLVTGPDPAAIRDAARAGDVLELMGKQSIRLVVNRVDPRVVTAVKLTVDDIMDAAGLPLLGIVPEDPAVLLAASFGKPLIRYSRRSAAATACKRIALRIRGIPSPIEFR